MGCRQCLSVSFFSRATLTIIGGAAAIRLEWTSFFFLKREVLCHSNRFLNEWDLIEELNFNWKPLWLCVYRLPSNRVLCAYVTVKFQCCTWKSSGDVLPRLSIRPKNEESCRNGKGQRGRASPSFSPPVSPFVCSCPSTVPVRWNIGALLMIRQSFLLLIRPSVPYSGAAVHSGLASSLVSLQRWSRRRAVQPDKALVLTCCYVH